MVARVSGCGAAWHDWGKVGKLVGKPASPGGCSRLLAWLGDLSMDCAAELDRRKERAQLGLLVRSQEPLGLSGKRGAQPGEIQLECVFERRGGECSHLRRSE